MDPSESNHANVRRNDIEGLRAIAVLSVIFHHARLSIAGHPLFHGGYLGVDVFFVISGYLIIGRIARDLEGQDFSIRDFYLRRARRILPGLFTVLFASSLWAYLTLMPKALVEFCQSLLSSLLMYSNVYFWKTDDYFSDGALLKPLIHTWSLGVEEQFYLFLPLIMILIHRKFSKKNLIALECLFLASFLAASFQHFGQDLDAGFYLLPFRLWELVVGGIVVFLPKLSDSARNRTLASVAALGGLGLILWSLLGAERTLAFSPFTAMAPVLGSALVIQFAPRSAFVTKLLSLRFFLFTGLLSYSLYLWHQPVFAFFHLHQLSKPQWFETGLLILLTYGLSFASFRWIESPLRHSDKIKSSLFLRWISVSGLALLLFGIAGHLKQGFPHRFPSIIQKIEQGIERGHEFSGKNCLQDICQIGDPSQEITWAIIGDSHAAMLAASFDEALRQEKTSGIVLAQSAYLKKFPDFVSGAQKLNEALKKTQEKVLDPKIQTVVLAARYTRIVSNAYFNNLEGGREDFASLSSDRVHSAQEQAILIQEIKSGIEGLVKAGKRILLLYPIPEVGWSPAKVLTRRILQGDSSPVSTSWEAYEKRNSAVIESFEHLTESEKLLKIHPEKIFCSREIPGRCLTHSGTELYYFDDDHLSKVGSDLLVHDLMEAARKKWGRLK